MASLALKHLKINGKRYAPGDDISDTLKGAGSKAIREALVKYDPEAPQLDADYKDVLDEKTVKAAEAYQKKLEAAQSAVDDAAKAVEDAEKAAKKAKNKEEIEAADNAKEAAEKAYADAVAKLEALEG